MGLCDDRCAGLSGWAIDLGIERASIAAASEN